MQAVELTFQVLVDATHPSVREDVISFETGASRAQTQDPALFAYEHHGPEFGPGDPGALTRFYEDLVLGVPLPLTMALREVSRVDTVVAVALFLYRDLPVHPTTPGFVAAVDLIHRRGPSFLGHVGADLARFLQGLEMFFTPSLSKEERGERLGVAAQWIRGYILEGVLPNLGPRAPEVRVLDVGTNGFVLAESIRPGVEAWSELYRQGHLRGVLLGPLKGESRVVQASKKSERVPFDLFRAAVVLNELETLGGGDPSWKVEGLTLFSPEDGTDLLVSYLLEVFLRV